MAFATTPSPLPQPHGRLRSNLVPSSMEPSMTCQDLANRIQRLQPEAGTRDVARLCLLLANTTDDVGRLDDDRQLTTAWREAGLRLQAATDQHAAMTEELESLARSDPQEFSPDQIWVL